MHRKTILAAFAVACLIPVSGPSWVTASTDAESAAVEKLQDAYTQSVAPGEDAVRLRARLATVLQRLKRSSVATVDLAVLAHEATRALESLSPAAGDPEKAFKTAVDAAAASMRAIDPYFRYVDARRYETERQDSPSSFGGLGMQVESSGNGVRIVSLIPDSPAARASTLAPGDVIVRVDDEPLAGMTLGDAIVRMRGQPGSQVTITVQRSGHDAEISVALTRETIRREVLRSSFQDDVLVLRLSAFGPAVAADLEQAVAQATATASPKAVVLDLRGNPGGLLIEAVKVADLFLKAGEIVSVRRQEPARSRSWQSEPTELLAGLPMIVLIDGRSASASELVADALQHHGRATVMGKRSYGKGSVQTTLPLGPDDGAIKLTTALYYGPSGRTVHRVGVAPDIELLSTSPVNTSGNDPDVLLGSRQPQLRIDPAQCAEAVAPDPALACAIVFLRTGRLGALVSSLD
ncbi:MAG TPA: S41 family peptidase, partial [Rubrivivax sp.]|nr:S41 family peptidase [Rubrivivax sp.]